MALKVVEITKKMGCKKFGEAVQLWFMGMIGEYILSIKQRIMKRPLVIEEERINFRNMEDEDARA